MDNTLENLEDYETLKNNYLHLKKELELTKQELHDYKRNLKTMESTQNDYKNEIDMLQSQEIEQKRKYQDIIKKHEKTIIDLRVKYDEEKQTFENIIMSMEEKNEMLEYDNRIYKECNVANTTSKFADTTNIINEILYPPEYYEVQELKSKIKELEDSMEIIAKKHAAELEYLKEILEDKKNDLMEAKSNNQFLTDENLYIRMELDSIKSQPLGNNTKGNSLFAEVDDRRVYLQDKINKMNESYLSLRQEKNQLETMNRHLKLENLRLLEKWNADIDEIDDDYAQEKLALRGTIQNLEDTVKKYKKELAEKPWIINKLGFEELEYFQVSLKELKDEIKSLKEKNVLYALNETFLIKELSEVKADIRKWRLKATTMENELQLLQNDTENQTTNNEQENKNLEGKSDNSRSSDAKKTSLKGKLSDIGAKQNLRSEKKDNFENKQHDVVENKENIADETKNSASEVHPKRVTFANDVSNATAAKRNSKIIYKPPVNL